MTETTKQTLDEKQLREMAQAEIDRWKTLMFGPVDELRINLSHPAQPAGDRVPMPTNAEQAEAMQKIGFKWLEQHAPERLAQPAPAQPQAASPEDMAVYNSIAAGYMAKPGMKLVHAGMLQLVRNCLSRDAEEGKQSRAEILQELDKATFDPPPAQPQGAVSEDWRKLAHQFDAQRMGAMWHLKAMLADPVAAADAARAFVAAEPSSRAQPQAAGEAVYQCQGADGRWTDQTRESYDYNVKHGQAVVRVLYTTPPASQQAAQAVPDWSECLRISEVPTVDEALRNFSEDATENNAVCIVQEVLRAAKGGQQ
jgi:hypothetical protein